MSDIESKTYNKSKRTKMTRGERAKQFMPFAALKGYEEALRKMEEEVENGYLKEKESEN